MNYLKRIAAVALCLCATPLCSFDFTYGSFVKVKNLKQTENGLLLPIERKKYANVRVLSLELYRFLSACTNACHKTAEQMPFTLSSLRGATTREGMWIGEVDFNNTLEVTFLIFKNKVGFGIKAPSDFIFLDQELKKRVETALAARAQEFLNESDH